MYMIREESADQGRRWERLYDNNRQKMAEVIYEYIPVMPFPLVLESWNLDAFHPRLLVRNQKTWFMEETAKFDEEGKFIAYNEGIYHVYQGEYLRPYYRYGTFDSSGDIEYDEKGRMLRNEYYVTHGGDMDIYLYEEDSDMPWGVIRWCCFAPGFEDIYLFLPQEP